MKRVIWIFPYIFTLVIMGYQISFAQTNTFPSSGNVGIGTTSPTQKLQVNGNTYVNGQWLLFNGGEGIGWDNTETYIKGHSTGSGDYLKFGVRGAGVSMSLLSNGDVGIGTENPRGRLHLVDNTGETVLSIGALGVSNLIIQSSYGARTVGTGAALGFAVPANTDGSNVWEQGRILVTPDNANNANAAGRMYLQTRYFTGSAWDWKTGILINSHGDIGVGTTNPTAKLAVNGTAKAKEMIVTNNASDWPDYVFEGTNDGRLGTGLETLEAYINAHKHLPGIPSGKEIAKKGQNLGEIQKRMLEQVEELTLYVIELKNENRHLRQTNRRIIKKLGEIEESINVTKQTSCALGRKDKSLLNSNDK